MTIYRPKNKFSVFGPYNLAFGKFEKNIPIIDTGKILPDRNYIFNFLKMCQKLSPIEPKQHRYQKF